MATKSDKIAANLADYVEVHTRIEKFYERYPEGSLQSSWEVREIGEDVGIVVEARAYRTADDNRPGVGLAWEPYPGATSFTKQSELMNAETSAWGRALAALGFEVHRGIASGNEVRARGGSTDGEPATDKQKAFIVGVGGRQGLFDKASLGLGQREAIVRYFCGSETLTKAGAGRIITALKDDPEKGAQGLLDTIQKAKADGDENAQQALALITSDVPADESDPEPDDIKGTPLDEAA